MKTNLKTCPDSPWKTAFEKEIRKTLEFEEEQTQKLDREQSMVAHFLIDLIKEILGES